MAGTAVKTIRVVNDAVVLDIVLSVGTQIYNVATDKLYVVIINNLTTDTLALMITGVKVSEIASSSSAQVIYDEVFSTEAALLAIDPATVLGQTYWAFDTKAAHKAVTVNAAAVWQDITDKYDEATDTFTKPATQDGQVLNDGQELFILGRNDTATNVTALNPKVFLSVGAIAGDEKYDNGVLANASDISDGDRYGLNTTEAPIGGKFKCTTYGDLNGVNTSAWVVDAILYAHPTIKGDMTDIKPDTFARPVAKVKLSHATLGILIVNTVANRQLDKTTSIASASSLNLTGQVITPVATPFYEALDGSLGAITTANQTAVVASNTIVGLGQDHVTIAQAADTTLKAGERTAQLSYAVSNVTANEKFYLEIYLADTNGVVIDSGTGLPAGTLGQPPVVILQSAVIGTLVTATEDLVTLIGQLTTDVGVLTGQRLLFHVLCEKVGTSGGDKTFTVYFGSNHFSKVLGVEEITTDVVVNKSNVIGATSTAALNSLDTRVLTKTEWTGLWVAGTYLKNQQARQGIYLGIANKTTTDQLEPQPITAQIWTVSDLPVWNTLDAVDRVLQAVNIVVPAGNLYEVSALRFWVANISATAQYTIYAKDNITGVISSSKIFTGDTATVVGWFEAAIDPLTLVGGNDFDFILESANTSGTTDYNHPWVMGVVQNNDVDPGDGKVSRRGDNTKIRVSYLDRDLIDRSAEVLAAEPGTIIRLVAEADLNRFLEYEVVVNKDNVTWALINTVLTNTGSAGAPLVTENIQTYFEVPVAALTDYVTDTGTYAGASVLQGRLKIGAGAVVTSDDGNGVDIQYQRFEVSSDWDIQNSVGSGASGGSGTDGLVPYVGAVADVNLGVHTISTGGLDVLGPAYINVGVTAHPAFFTEDFEGGVLPAGWTNDVTLPWSVDTLALGGQPGFYLKSPSVMTNSTTTQVDFSYDFGVDTVSLKVNFDLYQDTELCCDVLSVLVDGTIFLKADNYGAVGWLPQEITLYGLSGVHTITFQFTTDGATVTGLSEVAIDNLTFTETDTCTVDSPFVSTDAHFPNGLESVGGTFLDTITVNDLPFGVGGDISGFKNSINVAIGVEALQNVTGTGGGTATAVGRKALKDATEAGACAAIGSSALEFMTQTGASENTAVGSATMRYFLTGTKNTGVGAGAFGSNTTGSNNTGVGAWAGRPSGFPSDGSFSKTDSNCTWIGAHTGRVADLPTLPELTPVNNSTALGYGARVSKDNQMVLGDVNVTELAMGDGTVIFPLASTTGFVPYTGATTNVDLGVQTITTATVTSTGVGDNSFVGNVGIGSAVAPSQELEIYDGSIYINVPVASQSTLFNKDAKGLFIGDGGSSLARYAILPIEGDDRLAFGSLIGTDLTEAMAIQRATGNVGIGTAAPNQLLHIKSTTTKAALQIEGNDATTSDSYIHYGGTAGTEWVMGIDATNFHRFKLSHSSVLGTADAFSIADDGSIFNTAGSTPTDPDQLVTKSYVDGQVGGGGVALVGHFSLAEVFTIISSDGATWAVTRNAIGDYFIKRNGVDVNTTTAHISITVQTAPAIARLVTGRIAIYDAANPTVRMDSAFSLSVMM